MEAEQTEYKLVSRWDTSTAGSSLTCCTTTSAAIFVFIWEIHIGRVSSHLLSHSPNACHCQGWAGTKARSQEHKLGFHMDGGNPVNSGITGASQVSSVEGSWSEALEQETKHRSSKVSCELTVSLNACCCFFTCNLFTVETLKSIE